MKAIILFISLCISLTCFSQTRSPVLCQTLFDERGQSKYLDQWMSEKYPEIEFVITDPDAFLKKMRDRFEAKKKNDPHNPYNFDYSEIGLPLNNYINKDLSEKIQKLKTIEDQIQKKQSVESRIAVVLRPLTQLFKKYKLEEVQTSIQYYQALINESDVYRKRNSITYRELIEFSYFYARANGHFDTHEYSFYMRNALKIDRKLNGYRQRSIQEEYKMYQQRLFSVFQMNNPAKGFKLASASFENAFLNKQKLETIWVPSNAWLERDLFMRLMSKNINIIGITGEPIQADGFLRPGGDFLNHDVRHESAKFYHRMNYINKNGLNEAQISIFEKQSDKWWLELENSISKIKDPQLRQAVDLMAFSTHHDRGYPLTPSTFLNLRKPLVVYPLYFLLKLAGEDVGFRNPVKHFEQSYKWLIVFWKERQQEEINLILQNENLD